MSPTEEAPKPEGEARKPPFFLPSLLKKTVNVTPLAGQQPVIGELVGFNTYELRINARGRKLIVFKHAIYYLEEVKG